MTNQLEHDMINHILFLLDNPKLHNSLELFYYLDKENKIFINGQDDSAFKGSYIKMKTLPPKLLKSVEEKMIQMRKFFKIYNKENCFTYIHVSQEFLDYYFENQISVCVLANDSHIDSKLKVIPFAECKSFTEMMQKNFNYVRFLYDENFNLEFTFFNNPNNYKTKEDNKHGEIIINKGNIKNKVDTYLFKYIKDLKKELKIMKNFIKFVKNQSGYDNMFK